MRRCRRVQIVHHDQAVEPGILTGDQRQDGRRRLHSHRQRTGGPATWESHALGEGGNPHCTTGIYIISNIYCIVYFALVGCTCLVYIVPLYASHACNGTNGGIRTGALSLYGIPIYF